jgi:hypothetical protein
MLITLDEWPYEMIFGSDVQRDGVYLELRDLAGGDPVAVLDAFRWEANGRITFSAYREDVPLEVVEWFIAEARRNLVPPTDVADSGTDLPPSRPAS